MSMTSLGRFASHRRHFEAGLFRSSSRSSFSFCRWAASAANTSGLLAAFSGAAPSKLDRAPASCMKSAASCLPAAPVSATLAVSSTLCDLMSVDLNRSKCRFRILYTAASASSGRNVSGLQNVGSSFMASIHPLAMCSGTKSLSWKPYIHS